MKAIEFITKAKDGIIEIPQEYRNSLANELRVIILMDSDASTIKKASKKKRHLDSLQVKTKDLVFGREEANER